MAPLNLIPARFTFLLVFFFGFCSYYSPVSAQGICMWVVLPGSTTGSTVAALTGVPTASSCQAYCISSTSVCLGVSFDPSTNLCFVNQLGSGFVNFNSSTTATYYGLIKSLGVTSCNSATICTWSGQNDMHSFGASQISAVTNVNDCINYCNILSGCVAAEWNYNSIQCWVYNSTLQYPVQSQSGIYFFTNPNCQTNAASPQPVTGTIVPQPSATGGNTGSNVQSSAASIPAYISTTMINLQQGIYSLNGIYTVNEFPNSNLPNGIINNATSLLGCLAACSSLNSCTSIDWNSNSQCYLHNTTQSVRPGSAIGVNNYALTSGTAAFAWNLNPYINTNILGGFLSPAANLSMCQFVCQTTPGCQGIDFANSNSPGQQCFLLFTQSNRVNATNVTHYDLFFSGFCIWTQNPFSAAGQQLLSSSLLQLYQYNCYTLPGCFGVDCTNSSCSYSYNGQINNSYSYHYSFKCIGSNQIQSTNNVPYVTPQSTYPMAIKPAYIVLAGIGGGCILMVIVAVCVLCQYHLHDGNYVVQGQNGGTSTSNVHTHRPVTIVEDIKMEEDVEVGTVEENPYFNDRNSVTKEENEF